MPTDKNDLAARLAAYAEKALPDDDVVWIPGAGVSGKMFRWPVRKPALLRRFQEVLNIIYRGRQRNNEGASLIFLARQECEEYERIAFEDSAVRSCEWRCASGPEAGKSFPESGAIIAGEPELLMLFAETWKSHAPLNIEMALSTGQRLVPAAREILEQAFRAKVYDMYWIAETGPVAVECERHDGMHILSPHVNVYIADSEHRDAGALQYGTLLISDEMNPVLPIDKYICGDGGWISWEKCPCGHDSPLLFGVSQEFPRLFTPDWNVIIPVDLRRQLDALPLKKYHLVQSGDSVTFYYDSNASAEDVEEKALSTLRHVFTPAAKIILRKDEDLGIHEKYIQLESITTYKTAVVRTSASGGDDFNQLMAQILRHLDGRRKKTKLGKRVLVSIGQGTGDLQFQETLRELNDDILSWIADTGLECVEGGSGSLETLIKNVDGGHADLLIHAGVFAADESGFNRVFSNLESPGPRDGTAPVIDAARLLTESKIPTLNLFVAKPKDCGEQGKIYFASWNAAALERILLEAAGEKPSASPALARMLRDGCESAMIKNIVISGIEPNSAGRAAVGVVDRGLGYSTVVWDESLCNMCGVCVELCPMACFRIKDEKILHDPEKCIKCFLCVEMCRRKALNPVASLDMELNGAEVALRKGFLATITKERAPEMETPAWLLPGERGDTAGKTASAGAGGKKSLYILGLSIVTQQENSAALLKDGKIIGAVEEERFKRKKHYGWSPPGRKGKTLSNDPGARIEDALCSRSINALLKMGNITLDDVDYIAISGFPFRLWPKCEPQDIPVQMKTLRAGKFIFVPHHLAHAASAFRVSGFSKSDILTVDGSGDRVTAAFFRGDRNGITTVFEMIAMPEVSIGGGYETITQILGFGAHGQGSTMALAAMGTPSIDMSSCYSVERHDRYRINVLEMYDRFRDYGRSRYEPMLNKHKNLAASLQKAAEEIIVNLLREGIRDPEDIHLCLAGGVALNCSINQKIHDTFNIGPDSMFIQPAANDSGTALGAALEAHHFITGESDFEMMSDAYKGPEYSEEDIKQTLDKCNLYYSKSGDVAADCAELIADGGIVCWFQGRMEFGPRALGNRSILADPRNSGLKARLNEMKSREPWRPFGPSILKGFESDYFENAFNSPFMLLTFKVRENMRSLVPVVVHADGTTRPQSVDEKANPLYHSLISKFMEKTSVPMVVNTSFNTGDEPIVCTPEDAVRSFIRLGADYLAIGDFIVAREKANRTLRRASVKSTPEHEIKQGRRLHLRLDTRCNNRCIHCTIREILNRPPRSFESAVFEMTAGRQAGCTELVFMRGEPTLRDDILPLMNEARQLGYNHIQFQTNGRTLSQPDFLGKLLSAGATFFEISIYGDKPSLHDEIARTENAFSQTAIGIRNAALAGVDFMVTVPVITNNYTRLVHITALVNKLGAKKIQFNFARPVRYENVLYTNTVAKLSDCSPWINRAMDYARKQGMIVSTEGVPFCHLEESARPSPGGREDLGRHRVADLHFIHDTMDDIRAEAMPSTPVCMDCCLNGSCSATWDAYLRLFGTSELKPV